MIRKKLIYFLPTVLICVVSIAAAAFITSAAKDGGNGNQISEDRTDSTDTVFQVQMLTFEEIIQNSNTAIVGEYVEAISHEYYTEYKFKVKECLYGDVTDSEIYLFSNVGTEHVSEINYSIDLGKEVYESGKDYILVLIRQPHSILYERDRYMREGDLLLCEDTGEYTLYSQPVDIPPEMTVRDYILSVYDSVPHDDVISAAVEYDNELDETLGESEYIGVVNIKELEVEGKVHNGNTYRCSVESLFKGDDLNKFDDGTILITVLKDTVEVGSSYVIGFSPVDEGSLIYVQATASSVYSETDENASMILRAISE